MLLISWPNTTVRARTTRRGARRGPAPPTAPTRISAIISPAPELRDRRRHRDHPRDEEHRGPGDPPVGLLDRDDVEQDHRSGRQQGGNRRRHDPGREEDDHGPEHDDRREPPRPSGTAWRRTGPGSPRRGRPGRPATSASDAQSPSTSSVSPASRTVPPGPRSWPCRSIARTIRRLHHLARAHLLAHEPRARRDHDLRGAGLRRQQRALDVGRASRTASTRSPCVRGVALRDVRVADHRDAVADPDDARPTRAGSSPRRAR